MDVDLAQMIVRHPAASAVFQSAMMCLAVARLRRVRSDSSRASRSRCPRLIWARFFALGVMPCMGFRVGRVRQRVKSREKVATAHRSLGRLVLRVKSVPQYHR